MSFTWERLRFVHADLEVVGEEPFHLEVHGVRNDLPVRPSVRHNQSRPRAHVPRCLQDDLVPLLSGTTDCGRPDNVAPSQHNVGELLHRLAGADHKLDVPVHLGRLRGKPGLDEEV